LGLDSPAYRWITTEAEYVRWVGHYGAALRIDSRLLDAIGADAELSRGRLVADGPPAAGARPEPLRGERALESTSEPPPGAERVVNTFLVRFFEEDDLEQALPRIQELGGMAGSYEPGATVITVNFRPDSTGMAVKVGQLARLHGVKTIEPFTLRQLFNNVALRLMDAEPIIQGNSLALSGRGEIVAVADSGLDTGNPQTIHEDFAGRVTAIYSWPVAGDWGAVVTNVGEDDGAADARSGHGTHVAGSVCGNGAASASAPEGAIRGLAAEAELVFQAVEQRLAWTDAYRRDFYRRYGRYPSAYGLAGLPADLRGLFQQAYDAGARIHNNSWGGGDFGAYDHYAETVDRFMWEHKDMLILFAAGNDGVDADADGAVDQGSITPPGTAKNCLTVGAAESLRTRGGYQNTYGRLWPGFYPTDPLRNDRPSDCADHIAAFSSRGPTRDNRIKPDLVAPGTNIVSTRSQALGAGNHGWGRYDPLPDEYMFNGGTSMATPLVAGAAAVARQYLRRARRRRKPSAALLKATLIHAAIYRAERPAAAADERINDFAQGWGRLLLASILTPQPPVRVRWYDYQRGLNTGESTAVSCRVTDPSAALRITLAWTDYPGSAGHYPTLVNDLDLIVTSPSGQVYYGNCRVGQADCGPDRANNVERVVIRQPERGVYRIRVRAFNAPRGRQDFALVYSGGIA
jgi:subtilisin family serine protease